MSMEIPAGSFCSSAVDTGADCPFFHWDVYEPSGCYNPLLNGEEDDVFRNKRTQTCLRVYPNGAVITITAKEAKHED